MFSSVRVPLRSEVPGRGLTHIASKLVRGRNTSRLPAVLPVAGGPEPPPPPPPHEARAPNSGNIQTLNLLSVPIPDPLRGTSPIDRRNMPQRQQTTNRRLPATVQVSTRSILKAVMNRHLRPFGLKLGPLQAGAVYFPVHFMAVGMASRCSRQNEVGVFWPATGTLFAFLLLYPAPLLAGRARPGFPGRNPGSNESLPHRRLEYTLSGLLYFIKFAAAVLGVWLMHVSIRGPISFARLHHVLAFSAAAAVSTLATRLRRGQLTQRPRRGKPGFLAQCAVLVDRRLPRCADRHATAADHWLPRHRGDHTHARRTRLDLLRVRSIAAAARGRVPAPARRGAFAAQCSVHRLPGAGMDRHAQRAAPHGVRRRPDRGGGGAGRPRAASAPSADTYQLQTFLALCVLPVLLLQAVMAERDDAMINARSSDERYRAFVANSSEAIFRTELAEPMPITLSLDEQVAWVRKHAYVAECNTAFMVALGIKDAPSPMVGTRLGGPSDLVAGLHRAHSRGDSQRLPGPQYRARGAWAVRPGPRPADLDDRHHR